MIIIISMKLFKYHTYIHFVLSGRFNQLIVCDSECVNMTEIKDNNWTVSVNECDQDSRR